MLTVAEFIALATITVSFLTFLLTKDYFRFIMLFIGGWDIELSFYLSDALKKKLAIKKLQYFHDEQKLGENFLVVDHSGNYYYIVYNEEEYFKTPKMADYSGIFPPHSIPAISLGFLSYFGLSFLPMCLEWILTCIYAWITSQREMERRIANKLSGKSVTIVFIRKLVELLYTSNIPKDALNPNGPTTSFVTFNQLQNISYDRLKRYLPIVNMKKISIRDEYSLVFYDGDTLSFFLNDLNIEEFVMSSGSGIVIQVYAVLTSSSSSSTPVDYGNYLRLLMKYFQPSYYVLFIFFVVLGKEHLEQFGPDSSLTLKEFSRFLVLLSRAFSTSFIILSKDDAHPRKSLPAIGEADRGNFRGLSTIPCWPCNRSTQQVYTTSGKAQLIQRLEEDNNSRPTTSSVVEANVSSDPIIYYQAGNSTAIQTPLLPGYSYIFSEGTEEEKYVIFVIEDERKLELLPVNIPGISSLKASALKSKMKVTPFDISAKVY